MKKNDLALVSHRISLNSHGFFFFFYHYLTPKLEYVQIMNVQSMNVYEHLIFMPFTARNDLYRPTYVDYRAELWLESSKPKRFDAVKTAVIVSLPTIKAPIPISVSCSHNLETFEIFTILKT